MFFILKYSFIFYGNNFHFRNESLFFNLHDVMVALNFYIEKTTTVFITSCGLKNKFSIFIFVRLITGPVPPNRPIPTTGPIPTNWPIFPTTGLTFIRHLHKWADRNVKRDVSPRQCDEDHMSLVVRKPVFGVSDQV